MCGNGVVEGDEVCDDGNMDPLDGCENDCTSSSGLEIWTTRYDGSGKDDTVRDAAILPDGTLVAVGTTRTMDQGVDVLLWALNPDGTEAWVVSEDLAAELGSALDDVANGVVVTSGGDLLVVGNADVDGMNEAWDGFVALYDNTGSRQWVQSWDSMAMQDDFFVGVTEGESGNFYVVGYTEVDAGNNTTQSDSVLWKVDGAGSEIWSKVEDGGVSEDDRWQAAAWDGTNLYLTGRAAPGATSSNIKISAYDTDGMEVWTDEVSSPTMMGSNSGFDIAVGPDGDVYVTGFRRSMGGEPDVWVARYGTDGLRKWMQSWDGETAGDDFGMGLAMTPEGILYVAGDTGVPGEQVNIFMGSWDSDGMERWTASYNNEEASLTDLGRAVVVGDDGYPVFFGAETVFGEGLSLWARKTYP